VVHKASQTDLTEDLVRTSCDPIEDFVGDFGWAEVRRSCDQIADLDFGLIDTSCSIADLVEDEDWGNVRPCTLAYCAVKELHEQTMDLIEDWGNVLPCTLAYCAAKELHEQTMDLIAPDLTYRCGAA